MSGSPESDSAASEDGVHPTIWGSSWLAFALMMAGGIILPGLGVYAFEVAGRPLLSDLIWVTGYGTTVFLLWYIWLRPVDLLGSTEQDWGNPTVTDGSLDRAEMSEQETNSGHSTSDAEQARQADEGTD
jgi:hypothetical protein